MNIEKQSNNQKGGKRPGAGRKKGEPNKRTAEAMEMAAATGITPLEYMLQVMRDDNEESPRRLAAAQAAAPYVHAKLSSVELTGKGGGPVDMSWDINFVKPADEG